jgi:hypothetical protein
MGVFDDLEFRMIHRLASDELRRAKDCVDLFVGDVHKVPKVHTNAPQINAA